MFFRFFFLLACFAIVVGSCTNNDSKQTLLSAIDGKEHAAILDGKASVDKNTLLILYNRMEEVDLINRIYISSKIKSNFFKSILISFLEIINGGTKRTTFPPAGTKSKPLSKAFNVIVFASV